MNKNHYDDREDVRSFIKKLRIDDCFRIDNESGQRVQLKLIFEPKKSLSLKESLVSIEPKDFYFHTIFDGVRLSDIILIDSHNTNEIFLNPEISSGGYLQVRLQNTPDPLFMYKKFYPFSFKPEPCDDDYTQDEISSRQQFLKTFKASRDYLNYIAHQEGLGGIETIDDQRCRLYEKNNMPALLQNNPDLLKSSDFKIPLVTHKIWVTTDEDPRDPSDQYIRWYESSIEHNKVSQGWTHIFWIENREKQKSFYDKLSHHPSITVRELDSLTFETGDLYKTLLHQGGPGVLGQVSDILRLELLKQFGGFYLDTDYEVFQSLIPYSLAYDLIVGLDPMSPFLGNAFLATTSDHLFLSKALELIKRNFSSELPEYVKREIDLKNEYVTVVLTGPILITVAFTLTAGKSDHVDIVLPPQLIYPALADVYPMLEVAVPDGRFPPQTIGAHYWNNAWVDIRRMPA